MFQRSLTVNKKESEDLVFDKWCMGKWRDTLHCCGACTTEKQCTTSWMLLDLKKWLLCIEKQIKHLYCINENITNHCSSLMTDYTWSVSWTSADYYADNDRNHRKRNKPYNEPSNNLLRQRDAIGKAFKRLVGWFRFVLLMTCEREVCEICVGISGVQMRVHSSFILSYDSKLQVRNGK